MVATQKIQAGMIHAGKTVTVLAEDDSFRLVIDGETVTVVPRTTTREIHRYKAYAAHKRPPAAPPRKAVTPVPDVRLDGSDDAASRR